MNKDQSETCAAQRMRCRAGQKKRRAGKRVSEKMDHCGSLGCSPGVPSPVCGAASEPLLGLLGASSEEASGAACGSADAGASSGWAGASIFWEIMWTFLAAGSMTSGVEGRKPSWGWVEA